MNIIRFKKVKKLLAVGLTVLMLLVQSPAIYAQTAPTPPTAPENTYEAPEAPEAPTPPPNPYDEEEEVVDPTPTPEPEQSVESEPTGEAQAASDETGTGGETGSTAETESTGQTADGKVGDPEINTGDATVAGSIVNDTNNNQATGSSGSASVSNDDGGVSVVNKDNGTNSDNTGSATIVNNDTSIKDNSATVKNDLALDSTTGDNSTSKNVGDSSIDTGDANTTGTLVNTVNTNIDGVAVSEFNIADDHVGDIILDFASNCISGCGLFDATAQNSGNGSDSTNDASVDSVANNLNFQNNDATVENGMTLDSDSGNNTADKNTGGDSEITTGDANVAANVLNFANNNLEGAIIYGVVNIFGNLVGDIIFPDGTCCFEDALAKNSGNGSDSTNLAAINQEVNNQDFQYNDANIENNLIFDATTGDNQTARNTDGSSSIETGDANIDAQVVNIANTNISGGNWYMVLVNEAGKWIGKIIGADGNYYAGSEGLEFLVSDSGEITVVNAGNGSGSTNTGTVNSVVNNTNVQTNTANITNNLNLSANTGGNSASRNTGGDNSIVTGDANIVANIVNFVNNNITGGGTLYVLVVNVFGSWLGDFVGPGQEKQNETYAQAVGGPSGDPNQGDSGGSSDSSNSQTASTNSPSDPPDEEPPANLIPTPEFTGSALVASATIEGGNLSFHGDDGAGLVLGADTETFMDKILNFNLFWILVLIPVYLAIRIVRKKYINPLPAKRANGK